MVGLWLLIPEHLRLGTWDLLCGWTSMTPNTVQPRLASGHYAGQLLAIDPHHLRSYTKRQTRRYRHKENEAAVKTTATFFCLDVDSEEPVAFTIGTSARTATQATPGLLSLAEAILMPEKGKVTVLADKEHCTVEMFNHAVQHTSFDLLIPQASSPDLLRQLKEVPAAAFH
jgi:hypothetical protein